MTKFRSIKDSIRNASIFFNALTPIDLIVLDSQLTEVYKRKISEYSQEV